MGCNRGITINLGKWLGQVGLGYYRHFGEASYKVEANCKLADVFCSDVRNSARETCKGLNDFGKI